MSDDGEGKSIKIPSFLIGKRDGDKIKEAIHQISLKEIEAKKIDFLTILTMMAINNDTEKNGNNSLGEKIDFYFNKGHQVIVQGIISSKIEKFDTVNVDLWYSGAYELYRSGWNL